MSFSYSFFQSQPHMDTLGSIQNLSSNSQSNPISLANPNLNNNYHDKSNFEANNFGQQYLDQEEDKLDTSSGSLNSEHYEVNENYFAFGNNLSFNGNYASSTKVSTEVGGLLSGQDFSKDSLKFARRLSREFIPYLQYSIKPLIVKFLGTSLDMLISHANVLQADIVKDDKLLAFIYTLINSVWKDFSEQLSCSQNKKISKLTKDLWGTVFSFEGFWRSAARSQHVQQKDLSDSSTMSSNNIGLSQYFKCQDHSGMLIFEYFFRRIVFLANRALVLTFILGVKAKEESFRVGINSFDNFTFLVMYPELYELYNHKRGLFADQCCGSCKVCHSKIITSALLAKMLKARDNFKIFKIIVEEQGEIGGESCQLDALEIMGILTTLDQE